MRPSPYSQTELLACAHELAGMTFAELTAELQISLPQDLTRHKGWVGNLIEIALGAQAGSKPEQDFAHLGIELKTIPVDHRGYPLETTFVCLAPLTQNTGITWALSHVRQKLSCVLWMPIEGERSIPLAERHIGAPILWRPNPEQEQHLQQDWEELMDYIVLGKLHLITARLGKVLQLRPKGANNRAITKGIAADGQCINTLPLGFYLRKEFTREILQQSIAV